MTVKTAHETRNEYQSKMGLELGSVFYSLFCDISQLAEKWGLYLDLYGKDEATVQLLNQVAPSFFGSIQDIIEHDLLLHLSRLTDPPSTSGRSNLSLQRLALLCRGETIQAVVDAAVSQAILKSDFSRDWRNQLLAHRDLDLALGRTARPTPKHSRKDIREAIEATWSVMNILSGHFMNTQLSFQYSYSGSSAELIGFLRSSVKSTI